MRDRLRQGLIFLLLVGLFVAGAWFASVFIRQPDQVALIWPPAGLVLAALLVLGARWWPFIPVAVLLLHWQITPVPSLFIPYSLAANLLPPLLALALLRWLVPETLAGLTVRLGVNLILAGAVMSLLSALIGVTGMVHAGMAEASAFSANVAIWTLSNLFGAIAIVPSFLMAARRIGQRGRRQRRAYAAALEKWIWLLAMMASILAMLWAGSRSPVYGLGLATLPLALLLWSALRFEPLLTALATTAMALLVAAIAGLGFAGFSAPSDPLDAVLLLAFLCVTASVPQMLSAATHTNRVAAEALLARARVDDLTGLANRTAFEERVRAGGRPGEPLTLAYLDLDQFKLVNDTLSHAAGDELIRELAGVIGAQLAPGDLLSRIGGDEFGLLLVGRSPAEARETLERVREAVAALRFPWQQRIVSVTVSIGLVSYRAGERRFASLLTEVDSACFTAKELGGNRLQEAGADAAAVTERTSAMHWAIRIGQALDENRFELHCQRIVALDSTDASESLEILLRMRDGERLLPPAQFVKAAERFGLARRLDRHVLVTVLDTLESAPATRLQALRSVAINLSAATLMDEEFPGFLARRLKDSAVPARLLCFEITETSAVHDLKRAQDFIEAVRAQGCRFALDDFGTGFCSFAYLQHLQVDAFKIDGGFVREAHRSPLALAIVRAIVEIARVLRRRTVAEGVETEAQWLQMRALGVDLAQGFHLHRPEPLIDYLSSASSSALADAG